MVSILGYNAWKDKNCFDTFASSLDANNITIKNFKFRGVNFENNIDNIRNTDIPIYDAGYTLINSKFKYSIFDTIIQTDYNDINKIIVYRWNKDTQSWAKIKIYTIKENSWSDPNLEVMKAITLDSSITSLIVRYKIEYYKWVNEVSVLQEDQTKYLEVEYLLLSNFISDIDESFPLFINVSISQDRVLDVATIQPLMSLYPIIIKNSMTNYNQGTFSAILMTENILEKLRTSGGYDLESLAEMVEFKKKVLDFLSNGKPKCIRTIQGEMFIVNITGNINVDWINFGSGYNCSISFNWIEVAGSGTNDGIERFQFTY